MLRLWLTSTAIGTLAALYFGLDPFAPYLYEFIILCALVLGARFLMLVTGVLGSPTLMLFIVGALPLAVGYSERILQREIKPSGAFHRYGVDALVGLETRIKGSHFYGRITLPPCTRTAPAKSYRRGNASLCVIQGSLRLTA